MIKNLSLLILSGISISLSFYPFKFSGILAWIGFVPFFFAINRKSKKKAFFLGYLVGVIFWGITIYWLIHVTLIGTVTLILYLALYFGIFGFIFSLTYYLSSGYSLLFIPAVWVLGEYLRSYLFTGFSWALLGYSQYKNLSLIQLSDIGGTWLVSFVVMLINISLYYLVQKTPSLLSKVKYTLFILLVIGIVLLYGNYRLFSVSIKANIDSVPLRVSVIQGNISQKLKWQKESKDFIMERYFRLTRSSLEDNPDLIIWPEASLPVVKEEEPLYY
ncbi:MAG: apolipoprotein N-acyltransferase, partial [Candidatus Omnitrophica bacterium]|nr:apolipoprotein N-acyltransferase [Candidatus Omnitrophota bacterium]